MPQKLIKKVTIYKLLVPLKEPFVISLGPINSVQNIVVSIETTDGCTGWGECSPFLTINGESIDTCFIVGQYLAKALKGKNVLDTAACFNIMNQVIYGNNSIKSAFDIALHDIAAQHSGLPLYRFLGGNTNKILHTDMTVSIGTPLKMQADAIRFNEGGFATIKVKLGGSLEEDVERIKAIREGVGMEVPLFIDANQGWPDADAAIAILKALSPFNIEHCEEPIPRWQFMHLNKVSANSPIPIMADESCSDHHDAERLIALNACALINIKLGKSGGFINALKIVEAASKASIYLQVGGFMESRLGTTAAAHLALTSNHIIYCDFDTPLMFAEDPVEGGIEYKKGGEIWVPQTPGLGAALQQRVLKKLENVVI